MTFLSPGFHYGNFFIDPVESDPGYNQESEAATTDGAKLGAYGADIAEIEGERQ